MKKYILLFILLITILITNSTTVFANHDYGTEKPDKFDNGCTFIVDGVRYMLQEKIIINPRTVLFVIGIDNNLTDVTIPSNVYGYNVEELSFMFTDENYYGTGLKNINLPDTLKKIDLKDFDRTQVSSIHIPKNVEKILTNVSTTSPLKSITISEENPYLKMIDSVIYSKDMKTLHGIFLPDYNNTTNTKFVVPDGVKLIESYAFSGSKFSEIVLPEGIEEINTFAFEDSVNLEKINIPNTVKIIRTGVFENTSLERIDLPEGIEEIGNGAFSRNKNLKKIKIPEGIKIIDSKLFYDCPNLEEVHFPSTINTIFGFSSVVGRKGLFTDCPNLSKVYFYGNYPESIDYDAFEGINSSVKFYVSNKSTGWENFTLQNNEIIFVDPSEMTFDPYSKTSNPKDTDKTLQDKNNYKTFKDVPKTHWAFSCIEAIGSLDIIKGISTDIFAPEDSITRAQAITMIARTMEYDTYTRQKEIKYDETLQNNWYDKYIQFALDSESITQEMADWIYENPNKPITREEYAALLEECVRRMFDNYEEDIEVIYNIPDFPSKNEITFDNSREAIILMYSNRIIRGINDNGDFAPYKNLTRAEAATIMTRVMKDWFYIPFGWEPEDIPYEEDYLDCLEKNVDWTEYDVYLGEPNLPQN